MLGRVLHGEAVPQPGTRPLAKAFHYGLARMRSQIVHDKVDIGLPRNGGDLQQVIGKLRDQRLP